MSLFSDSLTLIKLHTRFPPAPADENGGNTAIGNRRTEIASKQSPESETTKSPKFHLSGYEKKKTVDPRTLNEDTAGFRSVGRSLKGETEALLEDSDFETGPDGIVGDKIDLSNDTIRSRLSSCSHNGEADEPNILEDNLNEDSYPSKQGFSNTSNHSQVNDPNVEPRGGPNLTIDKTKKKLKDLFFGSEKGRLQLNVDQIPIENRNGRLFSMKSKDDSQITNTNHSTKAHLGSLESLEKPGPGVLGCQLLTQMLDEMKQGSAKPSSTSKRLSDSYEHTSILQDIEPDRFKHLNSPACLMCFEFE